MLPELSTLLKYQHSGVIKSYLRAFKTEQDVANRLFQNMLRYLWISRKHELDLLREPNNPKLKFSFVMHEEMRQMDEMWHNFILHTKDYALFCERYFGVFIHHYPNIAENATEDHEVFAKELELYLDYVYENLSEEVVLSWFEQHGLPENADAA